MSKDNSWGNWSLFEDNLAMGFGDFLNDTLTFEPNNYSFHCPVLTKDYKKDLPKPVPFRNTPSIIDAHLHSPRFGYTSNITKILVNETTPTDVQAANDYLYGVLISSIILFGFLLLWTIVLVVFKCLGYDRVGFLSGSSSGPAKKTMNATLPGDEEEEAKVFGTESDKEVVNDNEMNMQAPVLEDKGDTKVVKAKVLLDGVIDDVVKEEAKSTGALESDDTNLDVVNAKVTEQVKEKNKSDESHDVENFTLKDDPSQATQPQDMSIDKTLSDLGTNDSFANRDDDPKDERMKPSNAPSESQPQATLDTKKRLRRLRIALLVTGTCIVICSVIMISKGVNGLWYTVNAGREGLVQGTNLAEKGVDIVDGLINTYNDTIQAAKQLDLRKICPSARDELCALNNPLYVAGDKCFPDADEVWNVLEKNQKEIAEQVGSIKPDLVELDILLHDINNQIKSFDWAFWVAGTAVLILAIITILQMIAMWLPFLSPQEVEEKSCGRKFLHHMKHSWFVVPLYIFVVTISWVFSTTFIIASMVSADFCYDSPNQRMVVSWLGRLTSLDSSLVRLTFCLERFCSIPSAFTSHCFHNSSFPMYRTANLM